MTSDDMRNDSGKLSAACRAVLRGADSLRLRSPENGARDNAQSDIAQGRAADDNSTADNSTADNSTADNSTADGNVIAEDLREHVESCSFCSEWLQRRAGLTRLLAQPVAVPTALRSPQMLDGIRERIIATSEESPLGRALASAMPMAPNGVEAWPEPGLESELVESSLAAQIRAVRGRAPSWSDVRESVLSGRGASVTARSVRNRALAGAGVAAAIILCVLLVRDTQRHERLERPEIVFADVTSLSGRGVFANERLAPRGCGG